MDEKELLQSMNKQKIDMLKKDKNKGFGKASNTNTIASTITVKDSISVDSISANSETTPTESTNQGDVSVQVQSSDTTLTNSDVINLITAALAPIQSESEANRKELEAIKSAKEESDKALETAKQELEKTKKELETASSDAKVLQDLGKLMGKPVTNNQLTVLGEGSQELRNYEKLIDTADSHLVQSSLGMVQQKNLIDANKYWKNNKKAISEGVEAILKEAGFLRGSGRITNAPTLVSDIPSIAFTVLSNYIRESTYDDLIHEQFFTTGFSPGTDVGLTTAIPNYPYQPRPDTIASRQLDPANRITTDTNPVTQRNITITIEELGLGKDTNARPISLTNFVKAFSMQDLEAIVMRNLGRDYSAYIDLRAYSLWFGASTILYPGQTGNLIPTVGSLTANDGVYVRAFFTNLNAFMKQNRFAAYMNSYYGYVHNPGSWAQYVNTLTPQERYTSDEMVDIVSKMMRRDDSFGGVVSGLRGVHNGFIHFEQNSYGVGAAGTTGSTNVTVATVPTLFDSNFAFGFETIGRSIALDVEIRKNEVNNYGRFDDYIWYAHQGFAEMNINANNATGQERRVIQVRNKRII